MERKCRVIAIIPAFNEEGKIENVIKRIKKNKIWLDEILVIDDGSSDNTRSEVIKNKTAIISHKKRKGVGAAIRSGINYALRKNFDIITVLSGDNQHNPDELKRILTPILKNGYDFVQGSRFIKGGKIINGTISRRILTALYPFLFFIFTGKRCSDVTNGFRAFKTTIFNNPQINLAQEWLNSYELEVYLLYKVYTSDKYKIREVPVSISYNSGGLKTTKMVPFIDWWKILRPLLLLNSGLKK